MNRETFDERIGEVRALRERGDREWAHLERDRLMADVLEAIAEGTAEEAEEFAREALSLVEGEPWRT